MPKVIITGFSVFPGVERNPTEDIIVELTKHNDLVDLPESWSMETHVLEVSVSSVQSFHRELKSQQNDEDCILIHLGVDMTTDQSTVKLEKCAYNNMTFRSPDQSGYQPQQSPIANTMNYDECCTTEINVDLLCNDLQNQHFNVTISTDPGRYLCNYVYFSSLWELPQKTCIFVHVPRVEILPLSDQINLITCLIKQLVVNYCNEA